MTIAQASRKTGIRNCYIQLYCQHGILPARQDVVSGAWEIPDSWLESWWCYWIAIAGGDIPRARKVIYHQYYDRVKLHGQKCDYEAGRTTPPSPKKHRVINSRLERKFARNRKRKSKSVYIVAVNRKTKTITVGDKPPKKRGKK